MGSGLEYQGFGMCATGKPFVQAIGSQARRAKYPGRATGNPDISKGLRTTQPARIFLVMRNWSAYIFVALAACFSVTLFDSVFDVSSFFGKETANNVSESG